MLGSEEHSRKLRWLLLGTFAAMLLLMGAAGIDALRSLRKLHQVSHEVTERYSAHNQALQAVVVCFHGYDEQIEQNLLTGVVLLNTPEQAKISTSGFRVHAAVHAYPQDSSNEEQSLLSKIDRAVQKEEAAFNGVRGWTKAEGNRRAHVFIEETVVPTRTEVLTLASAVSQLNDQRLANENEAVAAEFFGLQTRLSRLVATTLLAGLVLSLAAGYYILRLEQNGRRRYLALERSRQELEGLSKRLLEVQEAERLSISRELHDEVGQALGALLVDLGQLSNLVPAGDTLVKEQIVRIRTAGENAVRSIRDMALLLRPPMLDDLGLIPALEWQARETSRRGDTEVVVHADEIPDNLPDGIKTGIYRLVQEALQNAATHAHAKNAKVSVKCDPRKVDVEISDDGIGFDPQRSRGMGILGMEERVRQLGGSLNLQSAPGKGTTVHATFPITTRMATEK